MGFAKTSGYAARASTCGDEVDVLVTVFARRVSPLDRDWSRRRPLVKIEGSRKATLISGIGYFHLEAYTGAQSKAVCTVALMERLGFRRADERSVFVGVNTELATNAGDYSQAAIDANSERPPSDLAE